MKKILIVEDDGIMALTEANLVKKLGFIPTIEKNGNKAMELIQSNKFDLILMDIRINGTIDGIEVMQAVKTFSDVPVIYVSGNSEPSARVRAEGTNIHGFIIKPINFNELREAIINVLGEPTSIDNDAKASFN